MREVGLHSEVLFDCRKSVRSSLCRPVNESDEPRWMLIVGGQACNTFRC